MLLRHPRPLLSLFLRRPSSPSLIPFHLSTFAAAKPTSPSSSSLPIMSSSPPTKLSKKARRELPESVLKHQLDICSKTNDLARALSLYDDARAKGIPLSLRIYNSILYLCSNGLTEDLGLERGFEVFEQMDLDGVEPNEATFTSMARLAAIRENPGMAFEVVKRMKASGIAPKLRSYWPALEGFCRKGMAEKVYKVDAHMVECGVAAEEAELRCILRVSVDVRRGDKVYEVLHRIRASVRQVDEETARVVVEWFESKAGTEVGLREWDAERVKEGVAKGGGGWHGQGWLGVGKWNVVRTQLDDSGVCSSCWEKLVCIDIDPKETEEFASSVAALAHEREMKTKAEFMRFQNWLQQHGPFDAVIDAANVGLINHRDLNFSQLNSIVKKVQSLSPTKKLPLVVLHRSRVYGGPAVHPRNRLLLESWEKSKALYATPTGSNDDWYWLYAAVSSKCLLVTNDEMRDHLFQLLGNSFFPRWKEKHQVRLSVSRNGGISLLMPPPYSIVIQESENGHWHVPMVMEEDELEKPRQWLCITRPTAATGSNAKLSGLF
ncbi:Proteinaceous RNase P 1, chloroplastic/mitochondrial-like protein [Drosera capensis]